MATKKGIVVKESDFKDIDKIFETVPKGAVFTGTGTGLKAPKKKTTTTTKKKVKRK